MAIEIVIKGVSCAIILFVKILEPLDLAIIDMRLDKQEVNELLVRKENGPETYRCLHVKEAPADGLVLDEDLLKNLRPEHHGRRIVQDVQGRVVQLVPEVVDA